MSKLRRWLFLAAIDRAGFRVVGTSPNTPVLTRSSDALIEVSGVRSSWLTVERNCDFTS